MNSRAAPALLASLRAAEGDVDPHRPESCPLCDADLLDAMANAREGEIEDERTRRYSERLADLPVMEMNHWHLIAAGVGGALWALAAWMAGLL